MRRKGRGQKEHRRGRLRPCGCLALIAAAAILAGCRTVGGIAGETSYAVEYGITASVAEPSRTGTTAESRVEPEVTQPDKDPYTSVQTTTSPVRGTWSRTSESTAEVEPLLQNPELPSGCEATAATMLLEAYGYPVSMVGLAAAIPKAALEYRDGRAYAPHPSEAFVGDPFSEAGYGVFPGALEETLQDCIDEAGGPHTVRVYEGASESEILAVVDSGHPLCVWSTMWMEEIVPMPGWYIKRGGIHTDEYFPWPGNEHCYVLVGYDDTYVTVCDPLRGKVRYNRDRFFRLFDELGGYALRLE